MSTPLEDAYDAVREYLHGPHDDTAETREELRSVLWLCAEAVERLGLSGMALRDLGDSLTGAAMSPALRQLLDRHHPDQRTDHLTGEEDTEMTDTIDDHLEYQCERHDPEVSTLGDEAYDELALDDDG